MKRKMVAPWKGFLAARRFLLLALFALFMAGAVGGFLVAGGMPETTGKQLGDYLNGLVASMGNETTIPWAAMENILAGAVIWFLGLTIVGVPLVLLMLAWRGYAAGFTLGVFHQQQVTGGLYKGLAATVPASLVTVPTLLVAAVLSVSFSTFLIKRSRGDKGLGREILLYSGSMAMITVILGLAGLLDGWVTPALVALVP